jgi:polysaccharide export outer membrane protein
MTTIKEGSRFLGLEGSSQMLNDRKNFERVHEALIKFLEKNLEPKNPRTLGPWNSRPLGPLTPRTLLETRCDVMKKIFKIGVMVAWVVLTIFPLAYPQDDKEKKQPQAEWVSVSESYVIGPEDVLYIHVWKEEALSRTIPVRTDGKISLPLVDDVQAAGLTARQLKDALTKRLKEFLENPNVSVTVVEANSYKVYVSGQVRNPGVYRLRSETTLLQIIPVAGGFTDWANPKKILIIRKEDGKERRITVNYKKIMKGDGPDSNIILKAGDTIIVP